MARQVQFLQRMERFITTLYITLGCAMHETAASHLEPPTVRPAGWRESPASAADGGWPAALFSAGGWISV